MATTPPAPAAPKRSGLPRAFVGVCVVLGALIGAYAVLMLVSIATASTEHRTRTFRAVDALRVDTGSGDVTIIGEARDDVRVEMEIQRGMWRGAWQPDVAMRADGRSLRLGSDCSTWAHIGVSDCGASFTVHVPRGTRVAVDASSGDVTAIGIAGAVDVGASSGNVRAEDVSGPLTLDASSGDIDVGGFRGTTLSASASSGDIELRTRRAPRSLRAEASSGDVTIAVPDATYRVEVETDSGDENVGIRQDPDAQRSIEAKSSSGDVTIVQLADAR